MHPIDSPGSATPALEGAPQSQMHPVRYQTAPGDATSIPVQNPIPQEVSHESSPSLNPQ